jgi:hypothetical protein
MKLARHEVAQLLLIALASYGLAGLAGDKWLFFSIVTGMIIGLCVVMRTK